MPQDIVCIFVRTAKQKLNLGMADFPGNPWGERAAARLTAEERGALLALEEKLLDAFRAEAEPALARSGEAREGV